MTAETSLKEGMQITEEELIACGCRFIGTLGFDGKTFEKGGQFIYWDKEKQIIWRILPNR